MPPCLSGERCENTSETRERGHRASTRVLNGAHSARYIYICKSVGLVKELTGSDPVKTSTAAAFATGRAVARAWPLLN